MAGMAACGSEAGLPPKPDDLLSPEQLVPLLADLQVAEARAQHSARAPDTIQALYQRQETAIFRRLKVPSRQFQQSYAYYAARPAELEAIYKTLTDTLAMREVKMKVVPEPKHH
jgi:Domain of unknown function (DUF4296)